jgi:hypothetical protein
MAPGSVNTCLVAILQGWYLYGSVGWSVKRTVFIPGKYTVLMEKVPNVQ